MKQQDRTSGRIDPAPTCVMRTTTDSASARGFPKLRPLIRYGFVPTMLLGVNGLTMWLAVGEAPIFAHALVILGAIVLTFGAERVLPYSPSWNLDRGDSSRDVVHAFINETLGFLSVGTIPMVATYSTAANRWPDQWPFLLQVSFAVLVADVGITMAHVVSHRVQGLWRLHAVHHSIKRCYGLNGLLKHPFHQTIETLAGVFPLVAIGMPVPVATALAGFVAVQLLLQHSNVDYRIGPMRSVLALNEGHRLHHLKWPGVGDVNFGLFTLLWDRMLGTYTLDTDRQISSDDLGIARWPDYPVGYLAQLVAPFRSLP